MENTNSGEDNKSTIFGTDRSWNDPQALFEYQNSNANPGGGASKLNKRVFFPAMSGAAQNSESPTNKPEASNLNDAGAKSSGEGKTEINLRFEMTWFAPQKNLRKIFVKSISKMSIFH